MRREVAALKLRSLDSLVLAIELFNRPREEGRVEAVLIHLDHAFEMLLKASIRHRGGRIRRPREVHTIGFKECVSKCLSDADVKCLDEDQAIALQALNGWRDAAQHYLLAMSETQLYLATQGSVTLFDYILKGVFGDSLARHLPERVLPVSTHPPSDLEALLDDEFALIRTLISPRSRKISEAKARIRPVAILDAATRGEDDPPTEGELRRRIRDMRDGRDWRELFPGVASLKLDTAGSGLTYSLRLTKKEGMPVRLVSEGEPGATSLAVRRVNELDFYQFGFSDLASRLSAVISRNKLVAVVRYLNLQASPEFYKEFSLGRMRVGRYSQKALTHLTNALASLDIDRIWAAEVEARRQRKK